MTGSIVLSNTFPLKRKQICSFVDAVNTFVGAAEYVTAAEETGEPVLRAHTEETGNRQQRFDCSAPIGGSIQNPVVWYNNG